jgi:hypothetical protein
MAYENIVFRKANMTMVDGYFYMMDLDQDALIVKTDDGTQSFSYPMDTVIDEYTSISPTPTDPTYGGKIKSLEYDGRNFWTLENLNTKSVVIRRWYINNYVLKLRNTFTIASGISHWFDSRAFTVEHYHIQFSADEYASSSNLSVTASGLTLPALLESGMTVTLGPNSAGQVEELTVNSVGVDFINVNGTTSYNFAAGDPITFYNRIWLFNNYYGTSNATGALYAIDAYTGSVTGSIYPDGAYKDIESCTFYDLSSVVTSSGSPIFGAGTNTIAYAKATNLIFLDPEDLYTSHGSMSMDNLEQNQSSIIPIFDMAIEGVNIYRLQQRATYYGTTYTWTIGPFNYQLSTLQPFVTSISLRANPAILPANGVNNSTITAIVKDQYNSPMVGKIVYFTDDDTAGSNPGNITTAYVNTNGNGVAVTSYKAGTTAREVKITATVQQT